MELDRPVSPCLRGGLVAMLALVILALLPAVAGAQPFVAWATFTPGFPSNSSYVDIPTSPALNPTAHFTFEAWVYLTNSDSAEDCRSIAGKGYASAWWVGVCTVSGQPTLRSYLKGVTSSRQGGIVPRNVWTHVAVVFTGSQRLHYINGELAAAFDETGPLPTNTQDMLIGSDVNWPHSPTGAIDEVRLWSVARTQAQIRAAINVEINTPQPGLVAVYEFESGPLGLDALGAHNGSVVGSGIFNGFFGLGSDCDGAVSSTVLCLHHRFLITTYYRASETPGPVDGLAHVAINSGDSGVLWFFSAENWELMTKALDACGLNSRFWIYSAATTDRFFRMEVLDVVGRTQKIYFNYPGAPAPAVTDSDAFATCP